MAENLPACASQRIADPYTDRRRRSSRNTRQRVSRDQDHFHQRDRPISPKVGANVQEVARGIGLDKPHRLEIRMQVRASAAPASGRAGADQTGQDNEAPRGIVETVMR